MLLKAKKNRDFVAWKRAARLVEVAAQNADRGAGTMFRTVYTNHLDLSRLADHKAHFMIVLNMIVLSVVITRKHYGLLAHSHKLLIPNLILVAVCLTTIILASLATRPGVSKPTPAGAPHEQVNWFFYGDYSSHSFEIFHENLLRLANDRTALYEAMTRDLHLMGRALARKYHLLSFCYQWFYYGLLTTIAAYALTLLIRL